MIYRNLIYIYKVIMECKKPMIKPSILHGFMGFVLLILRIVFYLELQHYPYSLYKDGEPGQLELQIVDLTDLSGRIEEPFGWSTQLVNPQLTKGMVIPWLANILIHNIPLTWLLIIYQFFLVTSHYITVCFRFANISMVSQHHNIPYD